MRVSQGLGIETGRIRVLGGAEHFSIPRIARRVSAMIGGIDYQSENPGFAEVAVEV
jgi:hypothetical protein